MQIFATAITRLRLALADLPTMPHVHFVTIPDIVRIEAEDHARKVVRRYGLDTLLWGSYLNAEPPRIWLNLQNRHEQRADKRDPDQRDTLHPLQTRPVDDSMMIVDQNDAIDAYIVILLSYLRTLERRTQARQSRPSRFWTAGDRLSWSARDRKLVFLRLITRIIASIPGPLPTSTLDKTPRDILVEHTSDWVVQGGWGSDSIDNERLLAVMRHCIRLRPDVADHHYRLGALLCLKDDEAGALAAFERGQTLDAESDQHDRQWISAMATVYVGHQTEAEKPDKAKTVSYVARALVLGEADTRERLLAKLRDDELWTLRKEHPALWTDTADRLLDALLLPQATPPQTEPPQAEPPQAELPQPEPPQAELPQAELPQAEPPQAEPPGPKKAA